MALATARRGWLKAATGWQILAAICGATGTSVAAQQLPIGSVSTLDATVTGASSVANDRAQLGTSGTVVAKDHVAYVQLYRGGSVKVCATSGVHLTDGLPADVEPPPASAPASTASAANLAAQPQAAQHLIALPPLMVALDRGAMELRMASISGDIVMTPDLRFTFSGDGQLDLHIRVTRNGDTCVENRVAGLAGHPELRVGSLFGSETYNVLPGQHVLFEGGSLREVVDNESSPCGCPEPPVAPAAPVTAVSAKDAAKSAPPQAEDQHPFPAAVSQGLAPPPPVPQAPPGEIHTQIAATLSYPPPASAVQTTPDPAPKPPPPAKKSGFFHSLGRFFKRIF